MLHVVKRTLHGAADSHALFSTKVLIGCGWWTGGDLNPASAILDHDCQAAINL